MVNPVTFHTQDDTNHSAPRRLPTEGRKPGALLLGFEQGYADALQRFIEIQGYRVRHLTSPGPENLTLDDLAACHLILVNMDRHKEREQHQTLNSIAQLLFELHDPPWLVAISNSDDLPTRLAAYRAGAMHFLHNPIDSLVFIQLLNDASQPQQEAPYQVLLVDDDPIMAELEADMLSDEGMQVSVECDPLNVMTALSACQPDVLVLDVYMPKCQGTELAAVLRDTDAWHNLPIIFLSGETDISQQLIALDFGGDDFLAKPVQPEHLVSAVRTRARRWRQHQKLMSKLRTTLYEQEREHLALDQHAIICVTDALGNIIDVNSKFCLISGYARADALGKNPRILKSGITPEATYEELWHAIAHGQIWHGQLCNRRQNGSLYWTEFTIVPLVDQAGTPYQYVAVGTDVTAIKESELSALYQRDLQSMVSEVATRMADANTDNIDATIQAALETCGSFIEADRAYLFQFSTTEPTISNTHEWCREGITSEIDNCQNLPLEALSWWFDEITRNNFVLIPDVSQLPASAAEEKAIFESQSIQSMLCIPIKRVGRPLGFFGFDAVRTKRPWQQVEISGFRILGDALASVFARLRAERALRTLNTIGALKSADVMDSLRTALRLAANFLQLPIATIAKVTDQQAQLLAHHSPSKLALADGMHYPMGLYFNNLTQNSDHPIALMDRSAFTPDPILPPDSTGWAELGCYLGIPLRVGGNHYGSLNFSASESRIVAFDETDVDFVRLLGTWVETMLERLAQEAELKLAATAFESNQGMFITGADGTILRINKGFTDITGYETEDVLGESPAILHHDRHNTAFYQEFWTTLHREGQWQGELTWRRKNGDAYPQFMSVHGVKDNQGVFSHFVAYILDISERKEAERQIRNLAFYDPVTQLPNRRLLMDRLTHAVDSCQRSNSHAALLFIDLDHFKHINDTLGHQVGDLLLIQAAKRVRRCLRIVDTVARFGGDEFVVLCEQLNPDIAQASEEARTIANKLCKTLAEPFVIEEHDNHCSASIGITLFGPQPVGLEDLLKQADLAMYEAKTAGRNTARFFDHQMQAQIEYRSTLENALRKAIADQQFSLHYQVQVNQANEILGAEALVRWTHPDHGFISPAEFIPMAEQSGLIIMLGRWILEAAISHLAQWSQPPHLSRIAIAINISARQFLQNDFEEELTGLIQQYAVDPALIKLEITESVILENLDVVVDKMRRIKRLGVQFSLDDFGTGYSSLSYLKRLPFDQLKIDQSFVRDTLVDDSNAAIVRTIITLGQTLGLSVIAEGVEDETMRDFLLVNGCSQYQGYLFSRPLPADHFFDTYVLRAGHHD